MINNAIFVIRMIYAIFVIWMIYAICVIRMIINAIFVIRMTYAIFNILYSTFSVIVMIIKYDCSL